MIRELLILSLLVGFPCIAGQITSSTSPLASTCTIASASTVDIGASCTNGSVVTISGTTTVNSFGNTAPAGSLYTIVFSGALTVTNGANLNLPKSASLTTVANSSMQCYVSSNNGTATWYCGAPMFSNNVTTSFGGSVTSNGTGSFAALTATGTSVPANGFNLLSANTPTFYSASTAAGSIDSTQHWRLGGSTAPTFNSCGTSPSISGTDRAGLITAGSGVLTSCVVNFGSTWATAPRMCMATSNTATPVSVSVTAISATQVTFAATSLTSQGFYYFCE